MADLHDLPLFASLPFPQSVQHFGGRCDTPGAHGPEQRPGSGAGRTGGSAWSFLLVGEAGLEPLSWKSPPAACPVGSLGGSLAQRQAWKAGHPGSWARLASTNSAAAPSQSPGSRLTEVLGLSRDHFPCTPSHPRLLLWHPRPSLPACKEAQLWARPLSVSPSHSGARPWRATSGAQLQRSHSHSALLFCVVTLQACTLLESALSGPVSSLLSPGICKLSSPFC